MKYGGVDYFPGGTKEQYEGSIAALLMIFINTPPVWRESWA